MFVENSTQSWFGLLKRCFRKEKDCREMAWPLSHSVATMSIHSSQSHQHMKFSARPEHMLYGLICIWTLRWRDGLGTNPRSVIPTQRSQQDNDDKADSDWAGPRVSSADLVWSSQVCIQNKTADFLCPRVGKPISNEASLNEESNAKEIEANETKSISARCI